MRIHDRNTDLKYFNGDILILRSGAAYRVIRLNQPVTPKHHWYTCKSMITGNLNKIYPYDINEVATDKVQNNKIAQDGLCKTEAALLNTKPMLKFGEYEALKSKIE